MSRKISIIIVEDNLAYAESLKDLISIVPEFECIGLHQSAEGYQFQNQDNPIPDVVLLDLHLPGREGFSLIPLIKQRSSASKVIVITQEDSQLKTLEAIRLGVHGYISKRSSLNDIKRAINDVYAGGCTIDPRLCGHLIKALDGAAEPEAVITAREEQVLKLLAMGYTKKEIADQLNLSYARIAQATQRIYEKLQVTNIAAAVASAIRSGII